MKTRDIKTLHKVADEAEAFMTHLSNVGEGEEYGLLPREWFDCDESYKEAMELFKRLDDALNEYRRSDVWRIPAPTNRQFADEDVAG